MRTNMKDAGVHFHIQRRSSGPGQQSNDRVRIPRWERKPQWRPVHERSIGAYATPGAAFGSTTSNCTTSRASPRAQSPDAKSRGIRDNNLRLRSRGARVLAITTHCAEPTTGSRLAALVGESTINRADHPFSYLYTLIKGPYKRVLFFLEICQISRKFLRSDKDKNTRFLNAICQILKSNFPRFKRSSAMLKIIL